MKRLAKTELQALLEFIDCYPNRSVGHEVISRPSKIVPKEIVSHAVANQCKARSGLLRHPHATRTSFENRIEQAARDHSSILHCAKVHVTPQYQFHRMALHGERQAASHIKYRTALALNSKNRDFANRKNILLISSHNPTNHNSETVIHLQQKLSLIDRALYRLNLGLIFIAPKGKIRLATTGAMQHVTSYLGPRLLLKNRLPRPLWSWIRQQQSISKRNRLLLRDSPLILAREGKLVIRLVSDVDQSLLVLEEQLATTVQPKSLVPFRLSLRESQVLDWVSHGKTNKEVGMILELSPRTIEKHLEHIYQKIGVESRTAAAAKVYETKSMTDEQKNNR